MRKVNKSAPPHSFVTYCRSNPPLSYEDMDSAIKNELELSLLNEQGWVCGYCQQKIRDQSKMKVEHHCEQSICNGVVSSPDKRLDYTNMMAVCKGNEGMPNMHCDSSKGTFNSANGLPIELSPWNSAHINGITYSSTGLVKSNNQRHNDEINRILNLNTTHLKDMRKKKFKTVLELSTNTGNHNFLKPKMKRILQRDIAMGDSRFPYDFPGMSEFMLSKFC